MHHLTRRIGLLTIAAALGLMCALMSGSRSLGQSGAPTEAGWNFPSIGIVEGESVRISLVGLDPNGVRPRIMILDSAGNDIFGVENPTLPAVQFQAITVPYNRIRIAPEPGTGRKQFRIIVIVTDPNGCPSDPSRPGVEILNTWTGRTLAIQPPPSPSFH